MNENKNNIEKFKNRILNADFFSCIYILDELSRIDFITEIKDKNINIHNVYERALLKYVKVYKENGSVYDVCELKHLGKFNELYSYSNGNDVSKLKSLRPIFKELYMFLIDIQEYITIEDCMHK